MGIIVDIKQSIKKAIFGEQPVPMRIEFGIGRGIVLKKQLIHSLQRKFGLEELEIADLFGAFAPKVRLFVEVGASDGYYCLLVHKFNPEIMAAGFEPQDRFRHIFQANLRLNGLDQSPRFRWISQAVGTGGAALDGFFTAAEGPILTKIDVEGAEMEVLRSGEEMFRTSTGAVIVETHSADMEMQCRAFLDGLGYVTRIIPNAWWRIVAPEPRSLPHNRWLLAEKWR